MGDRDGPLNPPALAPFFEPRGVAVVGASRDPAKVGGSVLANLIAAGFPGPVVPVNSRAETVQGLPAVASMLAVEAPVDLAVIAVPAQQVLGVLEECVAKGVGGAVVISAGFREIGEEGREREAELRRWLRGQPLRVLGPNCLGWIRPVRRLNVTFAPGMPLPGGVAFLSHSGALAVAILDWSRARRLGFSLFASFGNQADLTETDLLPAVAEDPATRVIAAYLEGVADGRRFFEALRAAAACKPVVVLKAGRSSAAARAVSSHTGALAGSDTAFEAAVRQAGAVRAQSVEELFDLARALDTQPLPRGRRVLVVTNGGGLGIVATDAAQAAGLDVTPLGDAVRARLRAVLPPTASVENPVDLVGDADAARFGNALRALGAGGVADAALILLTAQAATDSATVARAIVGATRGWSIPLAAAFVGGARVAPGASVLEEAGVPCYAFPEPAVAALAGMARLAARLREPDEQPPRVGDPEAARHQLREARRTSGSRLGLLDLAPVLAAYGIPVAAGHLARTPEEAAALAAQLASPQGTEERPGSAEPPQAPRGIEPPGPVEPRGIERPGPVEPPQAPREIEGRPGSARAPRTPGGMGGHFWAPHLIAIKLVSPDITHKSDIGGVRLGLEPAEAAEAARAMLARARAERPQARLTGVLVQPMVEPGVELLLGAIRDPQFGPMVVVGFGGIYVEVLRDTAARLAPLTAGEAMAMLGELRMAPVLDGVRGAAPVDRVALAGTLCRFARLAADLSELAELEINPLMVGPRGVVAVDARATLAAAQDAGGT
jgi:acetyltransferase